MFSVAALDRFRPEKIHVYEPNPSVLPYLRTNTEHSVTTVFSEAVGGRDGVLALSVDECSLHSTAHISRSMEEEDSYINVPMVSFERVIERIGGGIDLLKLDCVGGEWDLLEREEV